MKAYFYGILSILGALTSVSASPTPTKPYCPTPTPRDGSLHNGDFECFDYYPWEPQVAPNTVFKLSSPGAGGSQNAWEFDQTGAARYDAHNAQGRLIQTLYGLTSGKRYTLGFSTWISTGDAGFWGVQANQLGAITVDGSDKAGPGVWNFNTYTFTPTSTDASLVFEVITKKVGAVFKLDNVTLTS